MTSRRLGRHIWMHTVHCEVASILLFYAGWFDWWTPIQAVLAVWAIVHLVEALLHTWWPPYNQLWDLDTDKP